MTNQKKAYIFAGLSILFWSTVATAFKFALKGLDYIQVLFISSYVALFSLLFIIIIQGKLKSVFKLSFKAARLSILLGFLNPFFYYLILFKAYELLPAQEAQTLNWTWPITLTLLSAVFLKQKLTRGNIIALFACFIGVIVISTHGEPFSLNFSNLFGDLLAIGSSVIWAFFWIFSLKDTRDPVIKLFWNFFFGSLYITPVLFLFSEFPDIGTFSFGAAVYTGLFEMGLTFFLWLNALNLARSSASVAIFAFLTPFISLIFIGFVYGEKILISSIIGLLFIIGGVTLQFVETHRNNKLA